MRVPLRVLQGLGNKGPCSQTVYTSAPQGTYKDGFKGQKNINKQINK